MKTIIYCKPTAKGVHSFYMRTGTEEFYLFSQAYRKSVEGLSMTETDACYLNLNNRVKEMEESIADNQQLIMKFESSDLMRAYEAYINQEVVGAIYGSFEQTGAMENVDAVEIMQNAMKQMALIVA